MRQSKNDIYKFFIQGRTEQKKTNVTNLDILFHILIFDYCYPHTQHRQGSAIMPI